MRTGIAFSIAAAVTGTAILAAAPASAFPAGARNQRSVAGPEATLRKIVFFEELYFEGYVPFYDEQNYCWQQVWTPHGWRWVDVCHGYAF